MSTELTIIPGIEANKLALITPESASAVKATYLPHFAAFLELEKAAQNVGVNRPKEAKIVRLDLRKVRVAADRDRKALGEEGRRYVEAVNQVYNLLEDRIGPLEKRLSDIEKAEEIAAAEQAAALKAARVAELTPFAATVGSDITFYDLANMPEAQYIALRDSTKAAAEAKLLSIKQAEEARVAAEAAKEAERVRLAEENRKLAAEAAERQKALDAERAKAEEARKAAQAEADRLKKEADEKLAKERAENEAKLAAQHKAAAEKEAKARAERETAEKAAQAKRDEDTKKAAAEQAAKDAAAKIERDRLAAEAEKARKEAQRLVEAEESRRATEAKVKAEQEEIARRAAAAPDKERLLTFAKLVRNLEQVNPKLTSEAGLKLSATISGQIERFSKWVETEAGKL